MGELTSIGWCDHTFNPWIGCVKVSPGCKHCYAAVETFPRVQRARGRELWGPPATTDRHVTSEQNWRKPFQWNERARAAGVRRRVFCASMGDVFEDHPALPAARARLWALIEATPDLDWLLLTKRPENVLAMVPATWWMTGPAVFPRNVWLGTSVEDQQRADERIPRLCDIPADTTFLSCEPLLGPVDLSPWAAMLDWVIIGGESGAGARPFRLEWARSIIGQCREAGAAPFLKQLGANIEFPHSGNWRRPWDGKGEDWIYWPEDLRVREWPTPAGVAP